jgi:hypothetical protein
MEALVNELAECRYPLEELRETPAWKVRLVTSRLALRALLACVTLPLALAPDGTSKSAVIVVLAVSGGLYGLMMLASIAGTTYLGVRLQFPEYGRGFSWANNGHWYWATRTFIYRRGPRPQRR